MDKDLARHVVATASRSSAQLNELIPLLKAHCEDSEYRTLLKAIATAMATIHLEIDEPVYAQYPDLKQERDANIKKYGKLI
jgi:hypothetical protein